MGVGSPDDLVEAVAAGVDMLDCALPTRVARNGALFTREGRVNVYSSPFRDREEPFDEGCDCYACDTFSAAYINHLFRSKELLAYRLATIHNLRFVLRLMEEMRTAIVDGSFHQYRERFRAGYTPPDQTARQKQREKQTAFRELSGAPLLSVTFGLPPPFHYTSESPHQSRVVVGVGN